MDVNHEILPQFSSGTLALGVVLCIQSHSNVCLQNQIVERRDICAELSHFTCKQRHKKLNKQLLLSFLRFSFFSLFNRIISLNISLEPITFFVNLERSTHKKIWIAQRGARTHDPEIKSLMLYRLS